MPTLITMTLISCLTYMSYEQTRNDMEKTFGSVPGFMNGMPNDVLVQMWPIMKTYTFGQTKIPAKYREMTCIYADC